MPIRPSDPLLLDLEGHAECLLGNEAIVRGALESGVAFAAGYPGTPSSEITDSFARVAPARGIHFEYSVNEKIALEMAFAASLAGARSLCAMKHLGLMYAGDPLSTIPYVGTVAGMVIVSAGDPSCRTSPNEQDQRLLAPMLHLPTLDPSTPQEAYAMTRYAFELSERTKLPVLLRPTTRVCHSRAVIRYGRLVEPRVGGFARDPRRFVPIPANARMLRLELTKRVETAERLLSESDFFQATGGGKLAVVATGAPAAVCADLLEKLDLLAKVRLISVGMVYPLPALRLVESLRGVERALVVEELSPYLEDALRAIGSRHQLPAQILGKRTGHFPVEFEYDPELIQGAIHGALDIGPAPRPARRAEPVPPRPPTLCPGCPHRAAQFAARTVFGDETLYFNDIGCYTLGYGPPLNTADALLCMGAGFTLAAGVSRVTGRRTLGLLGDSTFFHSGIPPLLNAIKENANLVAVILDNQVTAMTGFQESPNVSLEGGKLQRTTSIESVVRALGARQVETVDPHDLPATIAAFERARDAQGVSVVIAQRPCPVYLARETSQPYRVGTFEVDQDRCRRCGREPVGLRCESAVTERFQRHLARSRALEVGTAAEPRPQQAPCSLSCPLGLCIQGLVGQVASGHYREAFELIMSQIHLPDTVCRVCHRPCESVCVRGQLDQPVAVNDLKRFVVDWACRERIPYRPQRDPPHGKKAAVVGAGPSGLAASHELWLRGFEVTLFDAEPMPGGLLRTGIPPYRLPREALERDLERILELGVSFVGSRVLGQDLRLSDLLEQVDAVYLAVGAQRGIELGLPGMGKRGSPLVVDALTYLKEANRGEPREIGRRVVVVGGGNAAIDAARTARRLGAERVTVAYRRRREEMPAIGEEVDAAEREGVELGTQLQPVRVQAGGLLCVRTRPGEPDASGRSRPVPVEGTEAMIPADQIILAVGQAPGGEVFADPKLELAVEEDGSLRVDPETGQTSHPKLFAGGDLVTGSRTVTDALAAGRRSAWGIDRRLRGTEPADRRPPPPRQPHPQASAFKPGIQRQDRLERQRPPERSGAERVRGFFEVVSPLTEPQARQEAGRCMACGLCGSCRTCIELFGCPAFYVKQERIHIDPELCMGCGVCAKICPNGAIVKSTQPPVERAAEPPFGPVEAPAEEVEK